MARSGNLQRMQDDPRKSPPGNDARAKDAAAAHIQQVAETVEKRFQRGRRVLSFSEYLELFATDPVRYSRDASRYLRDGFEHFGTTEVVYPWGKFTRWNLFDLPWEHPAGAPEARTK